MANEDDRLTMLEKGVAKINKKLKNICENNLEIKKIYKGVQIYFSPVIIKPQFMFIGINPGQGYFKQNKKPVFKLKPLEKNEYIEIPDYNLSGDWNYVFSELKSKKKLEKSFKSNCYYFATANYIELKNMLKIIKQKYKIDIDELSKKWTREMIDIIKPNLIICEGFQAFSRLLKSYENEYCNLKENKTYKFADIGSFRTYAFKRNISSRFSNIDEVIDILSDEV